MKQYFTGFITATCLITSLFLFVGAKSNNKLSEPLIISGENGTTRIGDGYIEVDGPSGKKLFEVKVGPFNHGLMTIFNKNGKNIFSFNSSENGDGKFELYNMNGNKVVDLKSSSIGGFIRTYNSTMNQTAYFGTLSNNKGGAMFYNEKFDLTTFIGTSVQSDGRLALFNNKGNNVIRIGSLYNNDHIADGYISVHDRFGDYGWRVSGKK